MSLPWNKAVRLRIGAHHVQGVLHPAWSPRRTLAACQHRSDPGPSNGGASAGFTSSDPFDTSLAATLAELGAAHGGSIASAQILMADARVHFDVVSGDYSHLSDRQLQSVAQACVSEILGDRALGATVRWQLQKDAHHLMIAAVGSGDVDQIEQLLRAHGIDRISVQPDFCAQWNRHASALKKDLGVFATMAEGHMMAALVVSGSITAISCGPAQSQAGPWEGLSPQKNAIDDRVDRLMSSAGHEPASVHEFVLVANNAESQNVHARWQLVTPETELA